MNNRTTGSIKEFTYTHSMIPLVGERDMRSFRDEKFGCAAGSGASKEGSYQGI
jgi:hypothetical protein